MGRPPSNGGPAFRFTQNEVGEMEAILQEHNNAMPARDVLAALADKFSESPDRKGKITVQMKQVWNWFQNKRYAIRAKSSKTPGKLNITPMPRDDSAPVRNMPQPAAAPTAAPIPAASGSVPTAAKVSAENSVMEFEAKSGRDGAWYDVANFLSHRYLETTAAAFPPVPAASPPALAIRNTVANQRRTQLNRGEERAVPRDEERSRNHAPQRHTRTAETHNRDAAMEKRNRADNDGKTQQRRNRDAETKQQQRTMMEKRNRETQ
ncbi:Homeobox-like domain superfamily [Sesbania bispinosa]|nr:Homeobox-like domain superfamily [Sesbania bispinosa]